MTCHNCAARCQRHGRNRGGTRRYRCLTCRKTFSEPRRTIGNRCSSLEKSALVAELLARGNSVRAAAAVVGIEKNTVLSLLAEIGEGCAALLRSRVRNFDVSHLEIDEVWTFVQKKQRRVTAADPDWAGDAYCYIALDRATRLVVAWHFGKRDMPNTARFILKVRKSVSRRRFQISSDGWEEYEWAIEAGLADRADYARIVKVLGPGRVAAVLGRPDLSQTETAYVERLNGTLREWCRRYVRKTHAFSKKPGMLKAALALAFAHYNFCRIHGTLHITPAMAAGVARMPWTTETLLEEACL